MISCSGGAGYHQQIGHVYGAPTGARKLKPTVKCAARKGEPDLHSKSLRAADRAPAPTPASLPAPSTARGRATAKAPVLASAQLPVTSRAPPQSKPLLQPHLVTHPKVRPCACIIGLHSVDI